MNFGIGYCLWYIQSELGTHTHIHTHNGKHCYGSQYTKLTCKMYTYQGHVKKQHKHYGSECTHNILTAGDMKSQNLRYHTLMMCIHSELSLHSSTTTVYVNSTHARFNIRIL